MTLRIRTMSRGGWIVIGILIAMVLVPSGVAVAKALTFTGIEGKNGSTPTVNKAEVSGGGSLMTEEASPANAWIASESVTSGDENPLDLAGAPPGDFDVITQIQVNTDSDPSPGLAAVVNISFYPSESVTVPSTLVTVNPPTVGDIVIPFEPGQPDSNSPSLDINSSGGVDATVVATGYFAPCAEDPGAC